MTVTASHDSAKRLLVVTDLDGTLLDAATYRFDAARDALAALERHGIPLVLATSKTRAEVRDISRALPMASAAIVENGGGVVTLPAGAARDDAVLFELGLSRAVLVAHLAAIATETGVDLVGFASLGVDDVATLTGLPRDAARSACQRDYDEPFIVADEAAVHLVAAAAARRGLRVTRGGRFLHLVSAATDKADALQQLLRSWEQAGRSYTTIGLGDAPNDERLLGVVDLPVIIPHDDGVHDPQLVQALPTARLAPAPGPAGWNVAVLDIVSECGYATGSGQSS